MEAEMVEPDRTIMIVSIIGLVVIWGSFFYHKFVQGGNVSEAAQSEAVPSETTTVGEAGTERSASVKKKKNKKKR